MFNFVPTIWGIYGFVENSQYYNSYNFTEFKYKDGQNTNLPYEMLYLKTKQVQCVVKYNNNTVQWYNTSSPEYQFNKDGNRYYYHIIQ